MVKVVYQPWKEVIIHESIRYVLDDLVKIRCLGVQPGGLGRQLVWAEGVAFSPAGMPPTEDVIKEQLQGRVHWAAVEWASMPQYQNVIDVKEAKIRVPIINVSTNPILRSVAEWLKSQTG